MAKRNPQFENDAKQFGPNVALYNDGWLKGDEHGRQKGFARAVLLILGRNIAWTPAERRLYDKTARIVFGKKRR